MKKSILFTALVSLLFASCSSDEPVEMRSLPSEPYKTTTIKRLEQINESLKRNYASRGWFRRGLEIVGADIKGASKYGKAGRNIGGVFGSKGKVAGEIIGGLFGAIKYSWRAYEKGRGTDYFEPIPLGTSELTATYTALEAIDKNDFDYCLSFPYDGESIENVGEYHNRALAYLMDSEGGISLMSDNLDTPIIGEIQPVLVELTPLERSIVENAEFSAELSADEIILELNSIDDIDFGDSECGNIIKLYVEALSAVNGPEAIQSVMDITNQYVEVIKNSSELSESDKANLYVTFSVGAYSYKFWTNIFSE